VRITFVHLGREHLGIEYLSAVAKRAGHGVSLAMDPGLFGLNDNVFYIPFLEKIFDQRQLVLRKVEKSNPDLVAFSVYTGTYKWAVDIAREVKKKTGVKTVFGGVHATLVPEVVIQEECVDFLVVGEGEEAFVELLEALESHKNPGRIENLWHKMDGKIIENPLRSPLKDLDRLPLPDKKLFEKDINYGDDYLVMTSRGCPYSCSYCCESYQNKLYDGKFFRRRSVDSVLDELSAMKNRYNFRKVMFNDSIFFSDFHWLKKLLEKYRDRIGVPFRCFGRVNVFREEVAELLKWAGCYAIEFGVQTLNEPLRRKILNRPESNQDSKNAFKICDTYGISYDIDHMFGLPGEKEEDHLDAARIYGRLKHLNRVKCHNLNYFPKLAITSLAENKGILSSSDVQIISAGGEGVDFFHVDPLKETEWRRINKSYQTLYKFLPLLTPAQINFIFKHKLQRKLYRLPYPVVVFLQILVAVRGKDYRFILYVRYYYWRIKLWVRRRLKLDA